jgi:A/G-specific adenine glycosylase
MPMMGQYLVNAYELYFMNKKSPLLDVNMARVLERYFGKRKKADIRYDTYLQELASNVVSHSKTKELNWAILDFGAKICKAKDPLCDICPLIKACKYINPGLN